MAGVPQPYPKHHTLIIKIDITDKGFVMCCQGLKGPVIRIPISSGVPINTKHCFPFPPLCRWIADIVSISTLYIFADTMSTLCQIISVIRMFYHQKFHTGSSFIPGVPSYRGVHQENVRASKTFLIFSSFGTMVLISTSGCSAAKEVRNLNRLSFDSM